MGQRCSSRAALALNSYELVGDGGDQLLTATVLQVNSAQPAFPAPHADPARSLCASGGGARAMSFTAGVFRGLHELGLLKQLDALSSVSGGTWASSIYMFGKTYEGKEVSTGDLLGPSAAPSKLTMAVLDSEPAPLTAGLTRDSDAVGTTQAIEHSTEPWCIWQSTLAHWLLKPFGLESMDAFLAASEGDVKRIVAENPILADKVFLTPRTDDRPTTFVMNGTWMAPIGFYAGEKGLVSLQVSPDWTGSPFYPDDKKVFYRYSWDPVANYHGTPEDNCCKASVAFCSCCEIFGIHLLAGGGFVETFAYGGAAPSTKEQMGGKASVGYPVDKPMSLAAAAGISSSDFALQAESNFAEGAMVNPQTVAWPVLSDGHPGPQSALKYENGDGGELENTGMLALLQRGAKKVVCTMSCYKSLSATYDYAGATPETFDPHAAGVVESTSCLFGYPSVGISSSYVHNQVFRRTELLGIVRELVALRDAGKPAVVRFKCELLTNTWWGIKGGGEVEVLLIYLEAAKAFEEGLPEETQAELRKGPHGPFVNYPIYQTMGNNGPAGLTNNYLGLTSCQVNLLSAQGEYSVLQNADMFRDFLS